MAKVYIFQIIEFHDTLVVFITQTIGVCILHCDVYVANICFQFLPCSIYSYLRCSEPVNLTRKPLSNSDHWRKNISYLAKTSTVYSIDLIGYGYSEKPNPREFKVNSFYTFETWADQLNDFCVDVVKDEAFFICNSIGGNSHQYFS